MLTSDILVISQFESRIETPSRSSPESLELLSISVQYEIECLIRHSRKWVDFLSMTVNFCRIRNGYSGGHSDSARAMSADVICMDQSATTGMRGQSVSSFRESWDVSWRGRRLVVLALPAQNSLNWMGSYTMARMPAAGREVLSICSDGPKPSRMFRGPMNLLISRNHFLDRRVGALVFPFKLLEVPKLHTCRIYSRSGSRILATVAEMYDTHQIVIGSFPTHKLLLGTQVNCSEVRPCILAV